MNVLFITNIPSPYRVEFFSELGKLCCLTVIYEQHRLEDRDSKWTARGENYKEIYLKDISGKNERIVCQHLGENVYDVIVVGMYSTRVGRATITYLKRKKKKFILSTDGGLIKRDNIFKYMLKKYYISSASYWLSTGDMTTEYLVHYGAKRDKIYKYPFTSITESNILKKPLSRNEKRAIREKLGIYEEKMILSVGQFIPRKGYDILLEALSNLNHEIGTYIVGGEPTEEYLKLKEMYELKHVHFVPFMTKDKLTEYYKASDLFVLPTREDIWGLVINEAMSFGLPVITTDHCVAGCELLDERIGELVPTENVQKLTQAINQWINKVADSEDVLKRINSYTIEEMAKRHKYIFEQIIHE